MTSIPDICLDGIQYRAINLKMDAKEITAYVGLLDAVPDFNTLAEAYLEEAGRALMEALESVTAARAKFESLRGK